ncbi:MAG: response regulator transcription factor [Arcobacter sp.]|nr:response regulator transcription factor [Arcobacter sp.]
MVDYILLEKYALNKTVLIVEDDINIIKETKDLLELVFPNVDIAYDGEEAFKKYLTYKKDNNKYYDLVLTDIQMPKLNGIELTKLIYKENKDQLLIVLSAYNESKYLLELINLGISHFINKPLQYDSFIHIINVKLKELYLKEEDNIEIKSIVNINNRLVWNKDNKQILLDGSIVKLTKKEILFIELLMKYIEKTRTIDEILNYLWFDDEHNSPDIVNLKNIISRLRKKLPMLEIENIYGFGYRINLI